MPGCNCTCDDCLRTPLPPPSALCRSKHPTGPFSLHIVSERYVLSAHREVLSALPKGCALAAPLGARSPHHPPEHAECHSLLLIAIANAGTLMSECAAAWRSGLKVLQCVKQLVGRKGKPRRHLACSPYLRILPAHTDVYTSRLYFPTCPSNTSYPPPQLAILPACCIT